MTFIKINNIFYPAEISGRIKDIEWAERPTKTIKLTMNMTEALEIFVNNLSWSIIEETIGENNQSIQIEYDNSDYCLAGDITDHRDGTISIKMGKVTDTEKMEALIETMNFTEEALIAGVESI